MAEIWTQHILSTDIGYYLYITLLDNLQVIVTWYVQFVWYCVVYIRTRDTKQSQVKSCRTIKYSGTSVVEHNSFPKANQFVWKPKPFSHKN
jgi:hypothetical protein